jgi:hypothetical protein
VGPGSVSGALLDAAAAVWPGADRVSVVRRPWSAEGTRDYLVLPHVVSPRWLLPADAPHTAAALADQGSGPLRRLAARGLALAHRSGVVRRLPVRRLRVRDGNDDSLVALLREAFGENVEVGVRLAAWDQARGLVVRVFDPAGTTLAFGRLGVDDHGRAAVRSERHGLSRASDLGLRTVVPPTLIGVPQWRGDDVLLLAPLTPVGTQAPDSHVPVDAIMELAHAGASRAARLTSSGWWSSVTYRLALVEDGALRTQLDVARRALAASGTTELQLGAWHGDWTPWNMAYDGRRVLLWDWEHFAEDVPVGFDMLHYLAQHMRVSRGTNSTAEQAWRARGGELVSEAAGLAAAESDLVVLAYLLEVNLRFVLDRQGTPAATAARQGWGLDLLERESQRLIGG